MPNAFDLAARLSANAVDCLPAGVLAERLERAAAGSPPTRLRVKLGIDPTAPDIHLGHTVVLRKLREFQDAGHLVVLIVGDYTARVGDPSGRSTLRPMLSAEEIDANAATFHAQAVKILDGDPERLEVRRNSEWLDMPMADLLRLLGTATVAQLLERDDFSHRMGASTPISMLEMVYPLLQAYDSVAVRADLEIGGTDQKFNLLLGRDVQRAYGQPEQAILTMPILVGTDGRRKMSKSLGNQIGVADPPGEVYGKTLSIPDEAMAEYYALLLDRALDPAVPPREAKRELARSLVAWLHSPQEAERAEREFDRVFVQHAEPEEIEELRFEVDVNGAAGAAGAAGADGPGSGEASEGKGRTAVHLPALIASGLGMSRSDARRLIAQGGVSLDGRILGADDYDQPPAALDGAVLRVGKRRFRRLRAG